MVIGNGGVLYGATETGGMNSCLEGCGTVFSVSPPASPGGAWTEAVLYSFEGATDGFGPNGVVISKSGVLYGTTSGGGTGTACYGGCGTVFSLTPPASPGGLWSKAVLHNFGGRDGQYPSAPVVIGSHGVLYGTTELGGSPTCAAYECGTVFSLTPPAALGSEWTEAVLYSFTGGKTGGQPLAGVVITKSGVLYGTTEYGGNAYYCIEGCGTVFALKP